MSRGNFTKKFLTKNTKKQREISGFCLKAKLEPHYKITNNNP